MDISDALKIWFKRVNVIAIDSLFTSCLSALVISCCVRILPYQRKSSPPVNELHPKSDMYPLYWTSPVKGVVMKYDFIYKMNCVELFRSGRWPDTPEGIGQKNFRKTIVKWSKLADLHGIDVLRHPTSYKEYTAEERYSLVARVLAGESQRNVAISAGIYDS